MECAVHAEDNDYVVIAGDEDEYNADYDHGDNADDQDGGNIVSFNFPGNYNMIIVKMDMDDKNGYVGGYMHCPQQVLAALCSNHLLRQYS